MKRMTQFPACYTVLCFFFPFPPPWRLFVWRRCEATRSSTKCFFICQRRGGRSPTIFRQVQGSKEFWRPSQKKPQSSSVCGVVMWVKSQKVWGEKVSCKHHLTPTKMQLWFKPTMPPPSKTTRFSGHKHCYDIRFHISQPLQYLCVALLYECCKHICFYSFLDFRKPFVCLSMHEHSAQANQTV